MKEIAYSEYAPQFLKQLPKGAFLTVKSGDQVNTMTIGWGSIGYIWKKPVLSVLVRFSRYTYELIKDAPDFTVSVPLNEELKKALAVAGTRSGREIDKFKECNLTASPGHHTISPYIGECDLVYECKTVFKHPMDETSLDKNIKEKCYADNNWHVFFYGEILGCYIKD